MIEFYRIDKQTREILGVEGVESEDKLICKEYDYEPIDDKKDSLFQDETVHYIYNEGLIESLKTDDDLLLIQTAEWKVNRELLVSQIEIEYNGHIFQGDETSQDRMSRALNGLPDNGVIYWKAKDNSTQELDKSDLKEILFLAGQEQTRIWFENDPLSQGE